MPVGGGERWVYRANQEHAVDAHAFERLAKDAGLQRGDVCGDVRKLGHRVRMPGKLRNFNAGSVLMAKKAAGSLAPRQKRSEEWGLFRADGGRLPFQFQSEFELARRA